MATMTIALTADVRAPALARYALLDFLDPECSHEFVGDAQILAGELVTNSIQHAQLDATDEIQLDADLSTASLRVEVSDPGPGFDAVRASRESGGWGLILVERVSDRWGIGAPSMVWFEMDRS